jgi:hypothetical protein
MNPDSFYSFQQLANQTFRPVYGAGGAIQPPRTSSSACG